VTLLLAVVGGLHGYLARRLVLDPAWDSPWRELGLGGLALLFACLLLQPVGERVLRPARARLLAWPAALWMGFAFFLVLLCAAGDVALFAAGSAARADTGGVAGSGAAGLRAALTGAAALTAGGVALRQGLQPPRHRRLELRLPRWPRALDGLRIVQISDLHVGPILGRRFAAHVAMRVNALAPDLVAVTGDLVDGSARLLREEVAPLAALRARHGVFFVTGNHDHYSGASSWTQAVRALGMRPLRNERVEIADGGAVFDLAGVDDHRGGLAGGGGEDLSRALAGRDPERPLVLLAHDPTTFVRARERGVDLQLSGHTHGGQIWPFRYLVRLAIPYVAGLYRHGNAHLYVSRGTGFWGPPMRLGAPAEITEIVLRASAGAGGARARSEPKASGEGWDGGKRGRHSARARSEATAERRPAARVRAISEHEGPAREVPNDRVE